MLVGPYVTANDAKPGQFTYVLAKHRYERSLWESDVWTISFQFVERDGRNSLGSCNRSRYLLPLQCMTQPSSVSMQRMHHRQRITNSDFLKFFSPQNAVHRAEYVAVRRLSVCLSVCRTPVLISSVQSSSLLNSSSSVVSKRLNISSNFIHCLVIPSYYYYYYESKIIVTLYIKNVTGALYTVYNVYYNVSYGIVHRSQN